MPVSSSRLSYDDCKTLFDKALDDTRGARLQVSNGAHGATKYFIMRMHQFRALDRQDNRMLFPEPDAPLHGRSVYDPLVVQMKQDTEGLWWVYVSHTEIKPEDVELLSEIEGEAEA